VGVTLAVRNTSAYKRCYEKAELKSIADRVCREEGVPGKVEISVLFCNDAAIRGMNAQYGEKDEATDVLSFEQSGFFTEDGPRALGDIVISLETVHDRCNGALDAMRSEVRLLFCHGLLHLLGHDHDSAHGRKVMIDKQAAYLGCTREAAWFRGH
jgi:probable rRNA maturation factor